MRFLVLEWGGMQGWDFTLLNPELFGCIVYISGDPTIVLFTKAQIVALQK